MNFEYDICITHGFCPDGTASAWIVKEKFPFIKVMYGTHDRKITINDDFEGKNVVLTDYVPSEEEMCKIINLAKSVLIIDHHPIQSFLKDNKKDKLKIVFDSEFSACVITWQYFFPEKKVPWFLEYISDRDTYKFALPDSKIINEGLFYGKYVNFNGLSDLYHDPKRNTFNIVRNIGKPRIEKKERKIATLVKQAVLCTFKSPNGKEYTVMLSDCPNKHKSDVGNALCTSHPEIDFAAIYRYDIKQGLWHISCRSVDLNLLPIVSQFVCQGKPGGGHEHAAKFFLSSKANIELDDTNVLQQCTVVQSQLWDIFTPL